MRRGQATGAMLAVALFDVALAVAGLAIGVVPVSRVAELAPFFAAVLIAIAAAWLILGRLLRQADEPPTRIRRETASEWLRRFDERSRRLDRERRVGKVTQGLLAISLAAGTAVAVLRSGAEAERARSPRLPTVVVEHASNGSVLPWVAVVAGVLGLTALLLGANKRRAVAVAGASGALAFTLGHLHLTPRLDITPAFRVERPTLFSLQSGSATPAGRQVTLYSPVERRSLTLLSLGGLRISLHVHARRVPCHCKRTLPITP